MELDYPPNPQVHNFKALTVIYWESILFALCQSAELNDPASATAGRRGHETTPLPRHDRERYNVNLKSRTVNEVIPNHAAAVAKMLDELVGIGLKTGKRSAVACETRGGVPLGAPPPKLT
ncbi:MAG: hypothetical protein LBJ46_07550 [Planctomycetota bacterium]|nr:hypothetical protein [Planctomycetota bacterium]